MALKKPNQTAETPAFESMDNETQVVDQPTETVASPAAKAEATTAIAKAKATAVTSPKKGFSAALQELENQLSLDHVRALGVGTLPKLAADRAGFEMGEGKDKQEFGEWINFEIFSFNNRWLVSNGGDQKEDKDYLRTSYDEETLEDEVMGVKEYVQFLKDEGFAKAKCRHYIDVWGFVVDSENGGVVEDDDKEMIQLQLSPSSVKLFKAYQLQAGIKASMGGKAASNTVRATTEKREYDGNKYASIKFSASGK